MGEEAPTDTICFHAQQCVEKYLKALLVSLFIPFPKTHDVSELLGLIPGDLRPELEVSVQKRLTEYAIAPRYPNAGLDISIREARKAVAVARRVRKEVRRLLPRASLRQPKK
jgi:HEPN domain-containing protein